MIEVEYFNVFMDYIGTVKLRSLKNTTMEYFAGKPARQTKFYVRPKGSHQPPYFNGTSLDFNAVNVAYNRLVKYYQNRKTGTVGIVEFTKNQVYGMISLDMVYLDYDNQKIIPKEFYELQDTDYVEHGYILHKLRYA